MSWFAISSLAFAFATQAAPAPSPDEQTRALREVTRLADVGELFGMCGDRLPTGLTQPIVSGFSAPLPADASQRRKVDTLAFNIAYARGRQSPEATTITREQCMSRLMAINADMSHLRIRPPAA